VLDEATERSQECLPIPEELEKELLRKNPVEGFDLDIWQSFLRLPYLPSCISI
jgi:hypothetical protein